MTPWRRNPRRCTFPCSFFEDEYPRDFKPQNFLHNSATMSKRPRDDALEGLRKQWPNADEALLKQLLQSEGLRESFFLFFQLPLTLPFVRLALYGCCSTIPCMTLN